MKNKETYFSIYEKVEKLNKIEDEIDLDEKYQVG